jgi:hypothetical protein
MPSGVCLSNSGTNAASCGYVIDGPWATNAGYQITIQNGEYGYDLNGGCAAVTFPAAFAHAVTSITVTTLSSTDRITYVQSGSVSNSGFTVCNNGSSGYAYWMAIGY